MNIGIQEILITGGFTAVGSILSYLVGKRKRNAEVDSTVIKNTAELIQIYKDAIHDIGPKSIELKNLYEQLKTQYAALKEDYDNLVIDMNRVKSMACYNLHCDKRVKIEAVNELIKKQKQ